MTRAAPGQRKGWHRWISPAAGLVGLVLLVWSGAVFGLVLTLPREREERPRPPSRRLWTLKPRTAVGEPVATGSGVVPGAFRLRGFQEAALQLPADLPLTRLEVRGHFSPDPLIARQTFSVLFGSEAMPGSERFVLSLPEPERGGFLATRHGVLEPLGSTPRSGGPPPLRSWTLLIEVGPASTAAYLNGVLLAQRPRLTGSLDDIRLAAGPGETRIRSVRVWDAAGSLAFEDSFALSPIRGRWGGGLAGAAAVVTSGLALAYGLARASRTGFGLALLQAGGAFSPLGALVPLLHKAARARLPPGQIGESLTIALPAAAALTGILLWARRRSLRVAGCGSEPARLAPAILEHWGIRHRPGGHSPLLALIGGLALGLRPRAWGPAEAAPSLGLLALALLGWALLPAVLGWLAGRLCPAVRRAVRLALVPPVAAALGLAGAALWGVDLPASTATGAVLLSSAMLAALVTLNLPVMRHAAVAWAGALLLLFGAAEGFLRTGPVPGLALSGPRQLYETAPLAPWREPAAGAAEPLAGATGLTVLCLGDELTLGHPGSPEAAYPARLEELLARGGTGARVAVAARPGLSSAQGLQILLALPPEPRPDVVVAAFGLADLEPPAAAGSPVADSEPLALVRRLDGLPRLGRLLASLERSLVLRLAHRAGRRIQSVLPRPAAPPGQRVPAAEFGANLLAMARRLRERDSQLVVLLPAAPRPSPLLGDYAAAARAACQATGAALVDPQRQLAPFPAQEVFAFSAYPNARGHWLLAEAILTAIRTELP